MAFSLACSNMRGAMMLCASGHSRPGRPSSNSNHIRYGAESGSKFRGIGGTTKGHCGLMRQPVGAWANIPPKRNHKNPTQMGRVLGRCRLEEGG
jgi:hypothetical protein